MENNNNQNNLNGRTTAPLKVSKGSQPKIFGAAFVTVLMVAAGTFLYTKRDAVPLDPVVVVPQPIDTSRMDPLTGLDPEGNPVASPDTKPVALPVPKPVTSVTTFTNGTYSAEGNYTAPSGKETIGVTLILNNDVVTAASVQVSATNPTSKKFQDTFAKDFSVEVVGKKITDVSLDVISGSSLTPKGFNSAVRKIEEQAQA